MTYGPMIVDIQGTTLLEQEKAILNHPATGGVLLFTRNFDDIQQLKALVADIREVAGRPLLVTVDHEGGRIWRFDKGFTKPPAAGLLGRIYDHDPDVALVQAEKSGWMIGLELLACGIDMSFAPVLDLNWGTSEVIGDRSYHQNPDIVVKMANAFIAGFDKVGMSACGKHFPGHGKCVADTHHAVAIDDRQLNEMAEADLVPFKELAGKLKAVMMAHVVYPQIDSKPAGFSSYWIQSILRDKLKFQGVVLSDCLSMKAALAEGQFITRARSAIDAGCDLVILTQQTREVLLETLNGLDRSLSHEQITRIESLKGDFDKASKQVKPEIASIQELT